MGDQLALALALEGRADAASPQVKQLVVLADGLSALPDPRIDERFAAALEARLLTEGLEEQVPVARPRLVAVPAPSKAPAEPVRRAPVVPLPRRRLVVRRALVGMVAAAALGAFPVIAAASALPGSPFYGLKQWFHSMTISLTGGSVQDGLHYAAWGQEKATEAVQLQARGADDARITKTLREADGLYRKAWGLIGPTADAAALRKLAALVEASERQLRSLSPELVAQARAAVDSAIDTTIAIQEAIARALGLPFLATTPPVHAGPAAPTAPVASVGSKDSTEDANVTHEDAERVVREAAGRDDADRGRNGNDAGEGCRIPGSENGLGDLGAPLTRFLCG